jgi:hypothetical protein
MPTMKSQHVALILLAVIVVAVAAVLMLIYNFSMPATEANGIRSANNDQNPQNPQNVQNPQPAQESIAGTVSSIAFGDSCPTVSFLVYSAGSDVKVSIDGATQFTSGRCEDIRLNAFVRVEGIRQADGGIVATTLDTPPTNSETGSD